MLLYIHIPFCRRKCHYCAFFSRSHTPELERSYLEALEKETLIRGAQVRGKRVTSIYLGGGTPTLLSLSTLAWIIDLAAARFSLDHDLEFTIEANPETILDKSYTKALKTLGVNRLSLGVQTLDHETLIKLGRGHTPDQALRAAGIVREAGLGNLGLDLIWGLPGQTPESWLADLRTLVRLNPEHISCYGLALEPGTPLACKVKANEIRLPRDDDQARMYVQGADYLESEGLLQYEVSNFARKGWVCAHNTGYWQGEEFLGLGPSAVSTIDGLRRKNPSSVEDYALLGGNFFEGLDVEEIRGQKLIRERVMLALRTTRGLSFSDYHDLTGKDFCAGFDALIKALTENNLARVDNDYFSLTRNGMLVSNSIIERFIS